MAPGLTELRHTDDIHVIVLHALPGGIVIAHQPSADSRDLVGTHRCPDAAAADGDPALDGACCHSPCEGDDEIGIVVAAIEVIRAEIDHLVPLRAEDCYQVLLQVKPTMIRQFPRAYLFSCLVRRDA